MKNRYLKITLSSAPGQYCIGDPGMAFGEIDALMDSGGPGDSVTVELVEMEQAEYDALPEFEGW